SSSCTIAAWAAVASRPPYRRGQAGASIWCAPSSWYTPAGKQSSGGTSAMAASSAATAGRASRSRSSCRKSCSSGVSVGFIGSLPGGDQRCLHESGYGTHVRCPHQLVMVSRQPAQAQASRRVGLLARRVLVVLAGYDHEVVGY